MVRKISLGRKRSIIVGILTASKCTGKDGPKIRLKASELRPQNFARYRYTTGLVKIVRHLGTYTKDR